MGDRNGDGRTDIGFFEPEDGHWYIDMIHGLSFDVPFDALDFGYPGSIPVMSRVVSGLAVQIGPGGGGTVRVQYPHTLNERIPLAANPYNEEWKFNRWSDGLEASMRTKIATGRADSLLAVFEHKLEGNWNGVSGTFDTPTVLVMNSGFDGVLIRAGGIQRSVERHIDGFGYPYVDEAVELRIEGGDFWFLDWPDYGNVLSGIGRNRSGRTYGVYLEKSSR
jgi:hypothetical protein